MPLLPQCHWPAFILAAIGTTPFIVLAAHLYKGFRFENRGMAIGSAVSTVVGVLVILGIWLFEGGVLPDSAYGSWLGYIIGNLILSFVLGAVAVLAVNWCVAAFIGESDNNDWLG